MNRATCVSGQEGCDSHKTGHALRRADGLAEADGQRAVDVGLRFVLRSDVASAVRRAERSLHAARAKQRVNASSARLAWPLAPARAGSGARPRARAVGAHRGSLITLLRKSASINEVLSLPCDRHAMAWSPAPGSRSAGRPRWKCRYGRPARGADTVRCGRCRGARRTRTRGSAARRASLATQRMRERARERVAGMRR
jgi:hypothetical protein